MMLGKLNSYIKKMKLEHYLTDKQKISSISIKDINVRLDTTKLLEENIGRSLFDVNHSNIFFNLFSGAIEIKTKLKKKGGGDLIKLKSFCTAKKITNKMKRQLTEQEKYLQAKRPIRD